MSSDPLPDSVQAVDMENEAGTNIPNSSHTGDSREKNQGVTNGSTTTETLTDAQLDVSLPLNWSTKKKFLNMAVPSFICFVMAFGSSIYAPGIPDVMLNFRVSEIVATLPLTTYVLGLSFGPMLSAPISETIGRLGTYRTSVPVSALFTLGAGFASSITALCILRFFAGFFGGASLPVCAGTSADLFRPQNFAVAGSFLLYFPFLGPAMGPFIGGFVTQHKGWKVPNLFLGSSSVGLYSGRLYLEKHVANFLQWSQYTLAIFCLVSWLPVFLLEETYLKVIMARRKRNQEVAVVTPQAAKPLASTLLLGVLFVTLLRPTKMLFTEPIVSFLSLYVAFNFAVNFMFFASVPYVFGIVYSFDRGASGLVFLAVGLGCTLSVPTAIILDKIMYQKKWHINPGKVAPEQRLWAAMLGAFGIPIGLFWFAWSSRVDVHWMVPIIGIVPFAWGNLCIYISTCMYLIDTYAALTAASAIAANGLLRYIMAGTFPLFTLQMYERLGIGWASSLLAFIGLAMVPIPWVLYKWGDQMRAGSHFETKEIRT